MSAIEKLPRPLQRSVKHAILSAASACRVINHGAHFAFDIRTRLLGKNIALIFDVGANRGQSIDQFRMEFPLSKIIAFEPDADTYSDLIKSHPENSRLEINNFGLSSRAGTFRFDNTSPVTEIHRVASDQTDSALPEARFTTLDLFCAKKQITQIDLLKIDTEGHDLEVLNGACSLLENQSIGIVICECSMLTGSSSLHVPFTDIHNIMGEHDYEFFGLYNQASPHENRNSRIGWANCAYVSRAWL